MNKTIMTALLVCLAMLLAACGSAAQTPAEEPAELPQQPVEAPAETAAPEAGQNPAMNLVGVYHMGDSTEALVEAEGETGMRITISFAISPWFQNRTVMSGAFDAGTLTASFDNATLTGYTYNSDGSVAEESVGYDDGVVRARFDPADNSLTITEVFDSDEYDSVYVWGPAPDMKTVSDPDHYASVTAMDKFMLETEVCFAVRTAYLDENWYALAGQIRYPITINGTALADADAFLDYMNDKTLSESGRQAMMEETLLDMLVSEQGIMMGGGDVCLSDPGLGTGAEPRLEIVGLGGIVER